MATTRPLMRDLPPYAQHNNGCGLASLLMLIDPPKNQEIKDFLDKSWELLSELYKDVNYRGREYYWALTLQYLLLKAVGYSDSKHKEPLYEFFATRLEYSFEDQRIINKFNQEQSRTHFLSSGKADEAYMYLHYLEGGLDYVTPIVLMKNIHTMKTDVELKILAEIFNYEFVFEESEDMTGAIYFTREQIKKRFDDTTKKKWLTLENLANQPDVIILYGKYHHWLAVRGIYRKGQIVSSNPTEEGTEQIPPTRTANISEKSSEAKNEKSDKSPPEDDKHLWDPRLLLIDVNDPASVKQMILNFTQLAEGDRFYIFRKRKTVSHQIWTTLLNLMQEDLPEEIRRYREFLKKKAPPEEVPHSAVAERIKAVEGKDDQESQDAKDKFIEMIAEDVPSLRKIEKNDTNNSKSPPVSAPEQTKNAQKKHGHK